MTSEIAVEGAAADPLPEVEVRLVRTPPRWEFQNWGASPANIHRVGGEATWVQDADHPDCSGCGRVMPCLMQLDTLDIAGWGEWLWGSGGIGYVFWCEPCRRSAVRWHCT